MAFPRKAATVRQLSETEAAYIAGFIEADGHIACVHKTARPNHHRQTVGITQKDPTILLWVKSTVGAGALKRNSVSGFNEYKSDPVRSWKWEIRHREDVRNLLIQLEPYLKIKRIQAESFIAGRCYRA